jgi:BASS family bile acid:Na+ symporter
LVAFILSAAGVGGVGDISIAVGPLIVRIVVSQVLPFFLGMAVRARLGRAADGAHPAAMVISNVSFVLLLGWILIAGSGDVISLAGPFLLGAAALIVLAILLGALLAPGPAQVRTTAGAVAGIRNAAPMFAVIAAEFADEPGILPAVAGIVVIELLLMESLACPSTG